MACYSFHQNILSRANGDSAVNKASYIAAEKLYDERLGVTFNYSNKAGVVHTEIMAPEDAPEWMFHREFLWNGAEKIESRKDGEYRLKANPARELIIALPHELTDEQRVELCREMARNLIERYGVVVDFAIHEPDDGSDKRNYHTHMMFSTRAVTKDGFGEKVRVLSEYKNRKIELDYMREMAADVQNKMLEKHGHKDRVDHRSYEDRDIDKEPTKHLGQDATALVHQGKDCDLADQNEDIKQANIKKILDGLTYNKATFTERQLAKALFENNYTPEEIKNELLADKTILRLYDSDGKLTKYYTTQEVRSQENLIMLYGEALALNQGHGFDKELLAKVAKQHTLDDEQHAALKHVLDNGGIKILEGRAGTGKSHTINAIRAAAEKSGYSVIGLAPTNTVADDMLKTGFNNARTTHSFIWHHDHNKVQGLLHSRSILILDEAAMSDNEQLNKTLEYAYQKHAKVILVGDTRQLSSVQRGGMFEALKKVHGAAELTKVRRQEKDWQKQASMDFAEGKILSALSAYEDRGYVKWDQDLDSARDRLMGQWEKDTAVSHGDRFIFAFTNKEVNKLNKAAQEIEMGRGRVKRSTLTTLDTKERGQVSVAEGDKIQFRETDKRLGITNGMSGTVQKISGGEFTILNDGGDLITFHKDNYSEISLGYAGTIYRGQGKTLDQTYLLHTHHWRREISYVAMTRARKTARIYVDQSETHDLKKLAKQMARTGNDGASLEYGLEAKKVKTVQDRPPEKAKRPGDQFGKVTPQESRPQSSSFPTAPQDKTPLSARDAFEEIETKRPLSMSEMWKKMAAQSQEKTSVSPKEPYEQDASKPSPALGEEFGKQATPEKRPGARFNEQNTDLFADTAPPVQDDQRSEARRALQKEPPAREHNSRDHDDLMKPEAKARRDELLTRIAKEKDSFKEAERAKLSAQFAKQLEALEKQALENNWSPEVKDRVEKRLAERAAQAQKDIERGRDHGLER